MDAHFLHDLIAPEQLRKIREMLNDAKWTDARGPDRYRRALYTFRRRSTPYPFLQTFDTPNGDFSCVRRLRSNTPLQALMTLNESVSMECAQNLAGPQRPVEIRPRVDVEVSECVGVE